MDTKTKQVVRYGQNQHKTTQQGEKVRLICRCFSDYKEGYSGIISQHQVVIHALQWQFLLSETNVDLSLHCNTKVVQLGLLQQQT